MDPLEREKEKQQLIAEKLIEEERRYWRAMQEHDLETALELTDFPCMVAGASGARTVDQKMFVDLFSRSGEIKSFRFTEEPQVRVLNAETAVVSYPIECTVEMGGEEKTLNAVDTSTWVKRNGKWVCALHTETELMESKAA